MKFIADVKKDRESKSRALETLKQILFAPNSLKSMADVSLEYLQHYTTHSRLPLGEAGNASDLKDKNPIAQHYTSSLLKVGKPLITFDLQSPHSVCIGENVSALPSGIHVSSFEAFFVRMQIHGERSVSNSRHSSVVKLLHA